MDQKPKVERKIYKTYLAVIKNSIGATTFKNFFVSENGQEFDAMKNGELSCAFFVSGILRMFGLISDIHGTVDGTLSDMEKSGWTKINEEKEGAVVVYKVKEFEDGEKHKHIGFYIGEGKVISNSSEKGYPIEHNLEMDRRGIIGFYWLDKII